MVEENVKEGDALGIKRELTNGDAWCLKRT